MYCCLVIYLRLIWAVCLLLVICLSCDLLLNGLAEFAGGLAGDLFVCLIF